MACMQPCRDRERLEAKYREQLDTLTSRAGDLDTENRQLRGLKYELDSKVQHVSCWCILHAWTYANTEIGL